MTKIIEKALKKLRRYRTFLDGKRVSATGGDVFNWKSLYTDIHLEFIENYSKESFNELVILKEETETIFDLLKDQQNEKDYSFLKDFAFDAKITVKIKGDEFILTDENFAQEIRSLYNDFYLKLCNLLEREKSNFISGTPEKHTFKTTLSPEQLKKLFDNLKGKYIASDTDYSLFEAVFNGTDVNTLPGKIYWQEANNLLAYFIDAMIREKYIEPVKHWAIAELCFTNSKNLANASKKYKETEAGQPKKADIINEILKGL